MIVKIDFTKSFLIYIAKGIISQNLFLDLSVLLIIDVLLLILYLLFL